MLTLLLSQISSVEFSVVDEKGNPIPYCAYILYKDTLKVSGGYCDEKGNVKIQNLSYGNYKLQIDYIGYETKFININVNKDNINLGKISLVPKGVRLREQEVIAQPPIITYEQGKRIIRPSENITSSGGNALDILRNTPGVNVDNNDNIQIRGSSNFTLLINGRPTTLEPSDALRQIPASQIDRIEIITNPSARYEAEGNLIMNIVLKTTKEQGLNYSLNSRIGTYDNYGVNLLFGISRNKLKFSTSINYNKFNFPFEMNVKRYSSDSFKTNADGSRGGNPYGLRINLDYDIFSFEGNISHWGFKYGGNSITSGSKNYSTEFLTDIGGLNGSLYFGINKKFINSGFLYSIRTINENSYSLNYSLNKDSVIYGAKNTENGPANHYRFNFDFDNKKLAFGYLFMLFNRIDSTRYYKYQNNGFVPYDSIFVKFNRMTNALYATYSNNYKNINYQLGIRFENTKRNILNYEKNYNDLFPSFNIAYKLSNYNQIYFNYSRRINHPRPWQLEPFEVTLDEISKRKGNPDLDPEYSNSFEIGFQNVFLNVALYYRKTEKIIEDITDFKNNYFLTYPENVGFGEFYGSEISINLKRGRFIDFNTSFNFYQRNLYTNEKKSNFSYDIKSSLNLLFLQITGVYNSPSKTSQGETDANYYFDMGLRFPYKNFIFILNFSDIFKTFKFSSKAFGDNFYQFQNMERKWPSIQFMLIYNFQSFRKLNKRKTGNIEEDFEGF